MTLYPSPLSPEMINCPVIMEISCSGLREPKKTPIVITQQGIGNYSENDALWHALIDKVKAYNHSIAGVLRGCRIKSYDNKSLILETNFKFHKDKLSEIKTHDVLENALREVTKKDVKIEVALKAR